MTMTEECHSLDEIVEMGKALPQHGLRYMINYYQVMQIIPKYQTEECQEELMYDAYQKARDYINKYPTEKDEPRCYY